MSNNQAQFQEWRPPKRSPGEENQTAITRWLMKISGGLVKNQQQANKVLVIILIGVIIATILVLTLD